MRGICHIFAETILILLLKLKLILIQILILTRLQKRARNMSYLCWNNTNTTTKTKTSTNINTNTITNTIAKKVRGICYISAGTMRRPAGGGNLSTDQVKSSSLTPFHNIAKNEYYLATRLQKN